MEKNVLDDVVLALCASTTLALAPTQLYRRFELLGIVSVGLVLIKSSARSVLN